MNVSLVLNQDQVRMPDSSEIKGNDLVISESVADFIPGHEVFGLATTVINGDNLVAVVVESSEEVNISNYSSLINCANSLINS